jgi:hypothetical protein
VQETTISICSASGRDFPRSARAGVVPALAPSPYFARQYQVSHNGIAAQGGLTPAYGYRCAEYEYEDLGAAPIRESCARIVLVMAQVVENEFGYRCDRLLGLKGFARAKIWRAGCVPPRPRIFFRAGVPMTWRLSEDDENGRGLRKRVPPSLPRRGSGGGRLAQDEPHRSTSPSPNASQLCQGPGPRPANEFAATTTPSRPAATPQPLAKTAKKSVSPRRRTSYFS